MLRICLGQVHLFLLPVPVLVTIPPLETGVLPNCHISIRSVIDVLTPGKTGYRSNWQLNNIMSLT